MPQTVDRKKSYAKERLALHGNRIRAKAAEWRAENHDYLTEKSTHRRKLKRAMCLVAAARIRAKRRGLPFLLGAADVAALQFQINTGVCTVSGIALGLDGGRKFNSPSLDRIDPKLGYVVGNVRIVCHLMNAAMGDWGEATLRSVVAAWLKVSP